jgi:response regulator NasT
MNEKNLNPRPSRILLLDDERLILVTLGRGLRSAGFEVQTAESVDEAEAHLAGGPRPDLAILDVHLPSSSGLAFAQRLRELDHIPFLMLSAFSDTPYVEQAALSGALGYLVKPIDVVQLVPEVHAALARANELQDLRQTREQLQQALDGERDISMALGVLIVQRRIPRKAAFDWLRQTARQQRRRIAQVAADIVRDAEAV